MTKPSSAGTGPARRVTERATVTTDRTVTKSLRSIRFSLAGVSGIARAPANPAWRRGPERRRTVAPAGKTGAGRRRLRRSGAGRDARGEAQPRLEPAHGPLQRVP